MRANHLEGCAFILENDLNVVAQIYQQQIHDFFFLHENTNTLVSVIKQNI